MILVDTGYFLTVAQPRDALHARATLWATAVSGPFIVTDYVLWETVNSLSAPPDRVRAHALLRHVRESGAYTIVPATRDLMDAGLKLHSERPDKSWSLTDCISFVVMTEHGARKALAHDSHFEQAGFEALLRRDPP